MSLTVEQVLDDAKRLVERLRDHDNAADSLIEQSSALNKQIEAMKQYQEEVEEMNSVARHRPRSALILGIQQENRQIRELQRENRELRVALEEHQSALDLIMSSYREQVCRMLMANRFDKDCLEKHAEYRENSLASTAKVIEMAAVMKQAIELEEKTSFDVEQKMTRLQVENRGLRELLEISRSIHFRHSPIHQDEKKDKEKDHVAIVTKEGANNLLDDKSPPLRNAQSPKTNSESVSNASDKKSFNANGDVSSAETRRIDIKAVSETQSPRVSDDSGNVTDGNIMKQDGGDSGAQTEGTVDLLVECVLNDLSSMLAELDTEEDDESDA